MTRYGNTRRIVWLVLILAMLVPASASFACPVCFGEVDHPVIDGLQASIIFMVAVTYTVILGVVVAVILLGRRARRLQLAQQSTSTV